MEIVYVIIGIAALVAVYFLFLKKPEEKQLPAPAEKKLPAARDKKSERPAAPESRKESRRPDKAEEKGERAPSEAEEPEEEEPSVEEEGAPSVPPRPSLAHVRDVQSLRKGLAKSRGDEGFFGRLKALFAGRREISPEIAESIEEVLLSADIPYCFQIHLNVLRPCCTNVQRFICSHLLLFPRNDRLHSGYCVLAKLY
jgi:fused signal recognition particle receptor